MFKNIGIRKHEISSCTKLLFTFLSLRFFDMKREREREREKREREREKIFLCWLVLHRQLSTHSTTRGARSTQSRLASPRSESQQLLFFQIPKILSTSGHHVSHAPGNHFQSGFFIVISLIVTSALRPREHLHSTITHALTNPCTKRKVLW